MKFSDAYELYKSYYTINFKYRSIQSANSVFPLYILPYFKDYNIQDIKKIDILNWLSDLDQKPLAYKYKKDIYVFLAMFFKWNQKYLDLDKNVVSEVGFILKNKDNQKQIVNIWTLKEFKRFIKNVDNIIYKDFFEFLFFTGCRLGEVIALKFSDIKKDKISITKTLIKGTNKVNSPKTKSSIRTIEIDKKLLKEIHNLKKYYTKQNGYFNSDFYIFGGNRHLSYTSIERYKNKACKKANVKQIRLHDFRHSHISLLLSKGIPVKAIAERVGHKDISMTLNIYAHVLDQDKKRLIKTINFMRFFG